MRAASTLTKTLEGRNSIWRLLRAVMNEFRLVLGPLSLDILRQSLANLRNFLTNGVSQLEHIYRSLLFQYPLASTVLLWLNGLMSLNRDARSFNLPFAPFSYA